MSWHYEAGYQTDVFGDLYYGVYEVYDEGGHTREPVHPLGETLEELRKDLAMMLADVTSREPFEVK